MTTLGASMIRTAQLVQLAAHGMPVTLAANGEPLDATPALEPRPARDMVTRLRRSIAVT